jgi:hypothetical protein
LWVALAYADGDCDADAYSNAGTKGYANSATASHTGTSAVSSGSISAFFGNSRSN